MKTLGEREWEALSEKERQRRITQIKRKEKKLRQQGKHDEVAELFAKLAISEKGNDFVHHLLIIDLRKNCVVCNYSK